VVGPKRRFSTAIELVVCITLVAVVGLNALRRMDYFGSDTAQHIRMTDESRTAMVAKNIAEGRGYTANDLPAALVDFYDKQGKLHDENWPNADRFPFAAYATALLYTITRSTSWEVGILLYNLICFVAFLALLYYLARTVFDDRYAGMLAVTLALLHPYTFMFLYWKDGDMLLLTTAAMALLYRYFQLPAGTMSSKLAIGLGTVLAFLFLSRPNLGAPFILFFGIVALRRWLGARKHLGTKASLKQYLPRECLVLIAALVWCIPFVIQSMAEWGQPLFSANNLYQLPLGTRYGMGTDTWWKYTEPGHMVTLGSLMSDDAGELLSKFTSSWVATLKNVVSTHLIELVLATAVFARLTSTDGSAEATRVRALKLVAVAIAVGFVMNLAILPLYGYQDYSYRHYLSFGLPLLWLAGGRALALLFRYLKPALERVRDHVKAHAAMYLLVVAIGVIAWNLGASGIDANRLFLRTSKLLGDHWLAVIAVLAAVLLRRKLFKPPWYPRAVIAAFVMVYSCYQPSLPMKRTNFVFAASTDKVWDELRNRRGLVSSFALQGEVAWNTGRKNIPAPEWPMHVYSFLYDHDLEVEDVYIESAGSLISLVDGPFAQAAPGFEGYMRLQQYQKLPGYELAFHDGSSRAYPKFRIKPHPKASTVFKLVDRAAVRALAKSPNRIEVGDPANVIYTPHGWERYYVIDGKPVVAGTDFTRKRYAGGAEGPWEDSSVTFFLDQRHPTSLDLDVYVAHATSFTFYWNLDLYAYDRPGDRKAHQIGTLATTSPGWQHVHLDVPAKLARTGLNKLGFRVGGFQPVAVCPDKLADAPCLQIAPLEDVPPEERTPPVPIHAHVSAVDLIRASLFMGAIELHYGG
jgi:hypothetical protein